jgi:hypothetical protein
MTRGSSSSICDLNMLMNAVEIVTLAWFSPTLYNVNGLNQVTKMNGFDERFFGILRFLFENKQKISF